MQWVTRLRVSVLLNTARALIINFERYTMKYREKLAQQFAGLEKLSGSELRKRRDALNRAGYMRTKQSATFSTNVRGKTKTKGSSKAPQGWYTAGQFGR